MATAHTYRQQLSQFEKDLGTVLSAKAIAEKFVELYGEAVIKAVINSAKAGIGPGDQPYPAYSDSYKAQLGMEKYAGAEMFAKRLVGKAYKALEGKSEKVRFRGSLAAGNKVWLYLTGKMLDPKNFAWVIRAGKLFLVWTAPSAEVGVYAEVHNTGPKKMPKREWMHFDTTITMTAVVRGYEGSMRRLAEEFGRKWGRA
jgi:hypothetical protein